jgi:L-serine dehydratase
MVKQPVSIFNDVIGPVMRGPSSSHVAAAARIGQLVSQLANGNVKAITVDFTPTGSLATTYHGHGSDMGLLGGILGYAPSDQRLTTSLRDAVAQGINASFNIVDYPAKHPNTYRMTVSSSEGDIHITAVSIGGGMIELQAIENIPVSISGDFYETLVFFNDIDHSQLETYRKDATTHIPQYSQCDYAISGAAGLLDIKTEYALSETLIISLQDMADVRKVIQLAPVLPIKSRKDCSVPFHTVEQMLNRAAKDNLQLWELALSYESERGGISTDDVFQKMRDIVLIMKKAIEGGLEGTSYGDRILGPQACMIERAGGAGRLVPGDVLNTVIAAITAMMEVKSSMGVIVAAPTAGACGVVSGSILGTAREMGLDIEDVTKGMLAAGIIGVFIAEHATFAAEVCGCQAECGSGSGMAAAGLVQLAGGTAEQCVDAASMALQNMLGLVCDPVANRVEVPCLGRNVMGGSNALASANMALAGFDKVIPLDETIDAMFNVGKMLPTELRCTGCGGLSMTETSQAIEKAMELS